MLGYVCYDTSKNVEDETKKDDSHCEDQKVAEPSKVIPWKYKFTIIVIKVYIDCDNIFVKRSIPTVCFIDMGIVVTLSRCNVPNSREVGGSLVLGNGTQQNDPAGWRSGDPKFEFLVRVARSKMARILTMQFFLKNPRISLSSVLVMFFEKVSKNFLRLSSIRIAVQACTKRLVRKQRLRVGTYVDEWVMECSG